MVRRMEAQGMSATAHVLTTTPTIRIVNGKAYPVEVITVKATVKIK